MRKAHRMVWRRAEVLKNLNAAPDIGRGRKNNLNEEIGRKVLGATEGEEQPSGLKVTKCLQV